MSEEIKSEEMKSKDKEDSTETNEMSSEDSLKNELGTEVDFDKSTSENPTKDESSLTSEDNIDESVLKKLEDLSDKDSIEELDKLTGQNDTILEKDYLSGLIEQEDKEIFFEVENIYYNPEKRLFKNRLKMRKDPPVLVIRDNEGVEVKFKLTENLTDELTGTLKQVKRAYYGFSSPNDINIPSKTSEKIIYLMKKNKVKLIVTVFILLFLFALNLM